MGPQWEDTEVLAAAAGRSHAKPRPAPDPVKWEARCWAARTYLAVVEAAAVFALALIAILIFLGGKP